jgi:hypothetical protein
LKSLLPNCRFLALPSTDQGRDWTLRSREIDAELEQLGMDLSEESVYLLFDRAPGAVIADEANCLVARSIIGPKKGLEGPLKLFDWVQAPVHRKSIRSTDWDQVLEECYQEWERLQREAQKLGAPFMIVAKRRLVPELALSLEVLFPEDSSFFSLSGSLKAL